MNKDQHLHPVSPLSLVHPKMKLVINFSKRTYVFRQNEAILSFDKNLVVHQVIAGLLLDSITKIICKNLPLNPLKRKKNTRLLDSLEYPSL